MLVLILGIISHNFVSNIPLMNPLNVVCRIFFFHFPCEPEFHHELCVVDISPHFGRSFNDKPVNESATGPIGKELFEKEQEDLLSDLKDIPKKACDRRVSHCNISFGISYFAE